MPVSMVRCKPISGVLRKAHGDFMMLEIGKAQQMERRGHVEILDKTYSMAESVKSDEYRYLTRSSWQSEKRCRIAWVQDFSKVGGAEISNATLVDIGEKLGFDVAGVTPSNFHETILRSADMIIINNCLEFTREQMVTMQGLIYEQCIPYIKYDHDTREASRLNIADTLFLRSRQNIFISPAHRQFMQKAIMFRRFLELPLAFDADKFSFSATEREPNSVLVPCYRKCKTNFQNFSREHKEYQYYILGTMDEKPGTGITCTGLPIVSNDEMKKYYNRFEYIWHQPDILWAGERVYVEACLCGCKSIINDNVGHSSWGSFDTLKALLRPSLFYFWREVEKCL